MTNYLGRELSAFTLDQLKNILSGFDVALAERAEASKHEKFTKGVGNKKAMAFPTPNPEFMKLKAAIEEEIRKR